MQITFIAHSGFLVETEEFYMLFDYYTGGIPALDKKPLYVFASHHHGDHFSKEIFTLAQHEAPVKYILSNDIFKSRVPEALLPNILFVAAHEHHQLDSLTIETLQSTDLGVAFLVTFGGKTIYHAGDLNCWVWDAAPPAQNRQMELIYQAELETLKNKDIYAAFVPLDPRQEASYYRGMAEFFAVSNAPYVFPMHMWGDPSPIEAFKRDFPQYAERLMPVIEQGQAFSI